MVSWVGFRQVGIRYRPNPRYAGKSKYSLGKMLSLAIEGLTSFSTLPLRISGYLGLVAALVGLPYGIWAIYARLFTDMAVPGWSSLVVAILFLGGVQLMSIGVIGEYVGRIYSEVKRRPLYLTEELIGFDAGAAAIVPSPCGRGLGEPASPLPVGEGSGVRASAGDDGETAARCHSRPHPNPLPRGEGTYRSRFQGTTSHSHDAAPRSDEAPHP